MSLEEKDKDNMSSGERKEEEFFEKKSTASFKRI